MKYILFRRVLEKVNFEQKFDELPEFVPDAAGKDSQVLASPFLKGYRSGAAVGSASTRKRPPNEHGESPATPAAVLPPGGVVAGAGNCGSSAATQTGSSGTTTAAQVSAAALSVISGGQVPCSSTSAADAVPAASSVSVLRSAGSSHFEGDKFFGSSFSLETLADAALLYKGELSVLLFPPSPDYLQGQRVGQHALLAIGAAT